MITARELRLLRIVRALRAPKVVIAPGRTHKAGSAEAILKHCLKRFGLTKRYAAGKLTVHQHKTLLQAIRMEGRAWLRHEATVFAKAHFGHVAPAARALEWVPGPDGFLHLQEPDPVLKGGISRLFGRLKNYIRELIVAGSMAILGPAPLTGEDLAAADSDVALQEQFLEKFEADIERNVPRLMLPDEPLPDGSKPPPTPAQFIARVEKYADATWRAAQRVNRGAAIKNPLFRSERRVLGHPKVSHCEDCPPLADMGWQPLGSLPDIGDTECGCITTPGSRVLTRDGWVPIIAVEVGDEVLTHRLRWRRVTATPRHFAAPNQPLVAIYGMRGNVVGCTADHRWMTKDGWIEASDIAKRSLAVYDIAHENNMCDLWEAGPKSCQKGSVQGVHSDLPVRERQGSSGRHVPVMCQQRASDSAVGIGREPGGNHQGHRRRAGCPPDSLGGSNRGQFLLDEAGWSQVRQILARRSALLDLPLSMAMDFDKWCDSRRHGDSSQGSGLHERRAIQPGVDEDYGSSSPSRAGAGIACPDLDVQDLWEGVPVLPKRSGTKVLLLDGVPLRKGTALYDLTVDEDESFIIEGLISHNSLCLCHFRYSDKDGKEYFNGKGGPLPAPDDLTNDEIGIEEDDGGNYPVAGPPVRTRADIEKQLGVKFRRDEGAKGNKGYRTIMVDVRRVDDDLQGDPGSYVAPGGTGAAIGDRYTQFQQFLAKAQQDGTEIDQPRLSLDTDGVATIPDGRHRWAVLRDMGVTWLPVTVPADEARAIRRRYGAPARKP